MAVLEIRILQPRDYYLPGMWIEGIVLLHSADAVKARAVRLQFHGEAYTRFKVGDDHHSETHDLINAYLTLWGLPKASNDDTPKIPAGSYAFPFCVQIPAAENLPSSYSDSISHVRYSFKAYIDIPFAVDIEHKVPITVLSRRPLTAEMLTAVEQESSNDVGCCCAEGVIEGRVRLARTGAQNRERIQFTAQMFNRTKRVVTSWCMAFKTTRTYRAHGYTKSLQVEHSRADYLIVLRPGESFSNLNCMQQANQSAPGWNVDLEPKANASDEKQTDQSDANTNTKEKLTDKGHGGLDAAKQNDLCRNTPFSVQILVPPDSETRIDSKLITIEHQLAFRAVVDGVCTNDFTMCFPITICNTPQCSPPPIATLFCGSQFARSGAVLQDASKGEYCPLFSFDGLDYNPEDQFNSSKMVSYPCFHDENPKIVPPLLRSFSPAVYHLLTDGVLPQPTFGFVPIAPEQLQLATSALKPVSASPAQKAKQNPDQKTNSANEPTLSRPDIQNLPPPL